MKVVKEQGNNDDVKEQGNNDDVGTINDSLRHEYIIRDEGRKGARQ